MTKDVMVIDEMSMMTSYVLCPIKQRLKQVTPLINAHPFQNKLVLLVEDLAQLPPIYKHALYNDELICRDCQHYIYTMLVIRYAPPPIHFSALRHRS
jgi:hypothetical protein